MGTKLIPFGKKRIHQLKVRVCTNVRQKIVAEDGKEGLSKSLKKETNLLQ